MRHRIRIAADTVEDTATLNDSPTAQKVVAALPISSSAQVWGQEVYFEVPVDDEENDSQAAVPSGTLAYWPPGRCFCIFFGQRPASPVNVIGSLDGDPLRWAAVNAGATVRIEAI
jgi:hypothetical protein